MTGIANLKLIVVSGVKLVKCGLKVLEDGRIGIGDLGVLFSTLQALGPLVKVDRNALIPELKDLSPDEFAELVGAAISELKG